MSNSTLKKQRIFIYPLFFLFISLGYKTNAQSLSLRLNSLSSSSSFEKLIDDSLLVTPEVLVEEGGYNLDFTFQFKTIKNIQPYFRIGSFYTYSKQNATSISLNSDAKTESLLTQIYKYNSISTGAFTELINKNKFTLYGNLEFLYYFSTKNRTEAKTLFYDQFGDLEETKISVNNRVKPKGIEFGLGLRFEYLLMKNLGLYFDINYKYNYRWSKGIKIIQYEIINNQNEIIFENSVASEENDTRFGQYLPTAIGITWYLPSYSRNHNNKKNYKE